MATQKLVNICIVTFNRLDYTKKAIRSIQKWTTFPYVLTVVDNNSHDGTRQYLKKLYADGVIHNLKLLSRNIGVAKASNMAWRMEPNAEYYLKYDNDIVIKKKNWLTKLVQVVETIPFAGVVGYNFEKHSFPYQTINGVSVRLKYRNIGGACIMIPKRTERLLGHWCEDYGIYGEEDGDYGIRTELIGLSNIYMRDEHIGVHLPAGRGAAIDHASFVARDGVEEVIDPAYRAFKDKRRQFNQGPHGKFLKNLQAYRTYQKPFYSFPKYLYKTENREMCAPSSKTLQRRSFMHLEKMLRLKEKAKLKTLYREYFVYGKLLVKNGDYSQGEKYLKKALQKTSSAPFHATCNRVLGYLYEATGKTNVSKKRYALALQKSVQRKNKTVYDSYMIASLYKKIGNYAQAKKWFVRVVNQETVIDIRGFAAFHLGEIYFFQQNQKNALEMLTLCCTLCPHHVKARTYMKILKKNKEGKL